MKTDKEKKEKKVELKVKEWYIKFCSKYELDPKAYDIEAKTDRTLSIEENKDVIRTELEPLIKPELLMTKDEAKTIKDKEEQERLDKSNEVVRGWIKQRANEVVKTDKIELLKDYIGMTVKGNNHSLIVVGRAGLGKTYSTLNILKELKKEFVYKSGYTTPLGLYKWMYEHRDSVLVLDDLEGLLTNESAIALLKTALWDSNGKRLVSYETTSKLMEGVPSVFEFTGSIIILTNELNENNSSESYKALLSRAVNFELKFTHKEILEISGKILKTKKLSQDIIERVKEIIKKDINEVSEFNLRLLERLICMVQYDNDKSRNLFKASLLINSEMDLVLRLMKEKINVKDQIAAYNTETGKSRRSYFRIKTKVLELVGGKNEIRTKT